MPAETSPLLESLLGRRPPEPVDDPPPPEPAAAEVAEVEPLRQPPRPRKRKSRAKADPRPRAWTRRTWTRWLRQLGDDDTLSGLSFRLALALGLRHVDSHTGVAVCTKEALGRELRASHEGVRRAALKLAKHGHLEVEHQASAANIYRPLIRRRTYWRLDRFGTADPRQTRKPLKRAGARAERMRPVGRPG